MGNIYATQPTQPTLRFPSANSQITGIPKLHVQNGPPSPTVKKCAFPALDCPPQETISLSRKGRNAGFLLTGNALVRGPAMADDIQYHDLPDENEFCEPDDEEEEEEEPGEDPDTTDPEPDVPEVPPVVPPVEPVPFLPPFFIPNPHPWANMTWSSHPTISATPTPTSHTTSTTKTTSTTSAAAEPTEADLVDLSKDKKPKCYNSGYKANRKALIEAIEDLCQKVGQALSENGLTDLGPGLYQSDRNFKVKGQKYTDYVTTFEIKDTCRWWKYGRYDCNQEFRKIVDGCNTGGENGKQGGTMEGNCVKWRVDPNQETWSG
jgi:hypothetical protein